MVVDYGIGVKKKNWLNSVLPECLGFRTSCLHERERKARLREILQSKHPELFTRNLKRTPPGELEKEDGRDIYGMAGGTRDKAIRFFTTAADYVGVEISPLINVGKKNGNGATNGTRKRLARRKPPNDQAAPVSAATNAGASKVVTLASGGTLTPSATLDLFSLNTFDRRFVFELIDKREGYEQPQHSTEGKPLA